MQGRSGSTRRASRAVCALAAALGALLAGARPARAQRAGGSVEPITREQAVARALTTGAQAAIAQAIARAAAAQLLAARAFPNPTLTATYSKATPQYHAIVDMPLDVLWLRPARVAAALSADEAARYRLAYARAAVRLDVDTLYTGAVAAAARAALSRRNAMDADSLLTIAQVRERAGDASELDVELARVNAGEAENAAATDSAGAVASVLDLQTAIGISARAPAIAPADTLALPSPDSLARLAGRAPGETPLAVAAAQRDVRAAELSLAAARRSVWSGVSLQAGIEEHDPTGSEPGLLPTVGVSIPLPILDRQRGQVALATAERDRARDALLLARLESDAAITRARRDLLAAAARVQRDRALVASAARVASMSLHAYAAGAYALANVLEAQRNARDVLVRLIDDTAAATTAAATLRLFTTTAP